VNIATVGKAQLALALSRDVSAAGRVRSNEVPEVTAYGWANDAEVQKKREQERVAAFARERL
jgi:hypothetical protein